MNHQHKSRKLWTLGIALFTGIFVATPVLSQSSVAVISQAELTQPGFAFPADPPATADHQELSNYAWRLFIAASQTAGQTRGEPDPGKSFVDSGQSSNPGEPLVWETFYHRSEAYPYYDTSGAKPTKPNTSTSKLPTYYFQPDKSNKPLTVKKGQWNNLDENNEIAQNTLFFPKGTPHPGTPSADSQVLYQAKVNINELDYVYAMAPQKTLNFNFPVTGNGTIEVKSAWRLAADIGDTSRYHTAMATYYTGEEKDVKAETAEFALLALHIIVKTNNHPTFVFATFEQVDSLVAADGATATGLYYLPTYTQIDYLPANSDENPTATYTGAYTSIKPTTLAANAISTTTLPAGGAVPNHTTVIQPKTITSDVVNANKHVHSLLPSGSVWQYYALKGIQSLETNTTGTGMARKGDETSPDYYLANIVVESSQPGVQLFRGGAPGPTGPSLQPQRDSNNVTAPDGTKVIIGGCKGCHGVAQQKGQDFSFLAKAIGLLDASGNLSRMPGFYPDPLLENASMAAVKAQAAQSPRNVSN